jgi:agmatinase
MTRQQSAGDYLRHGQIPFFRLPLADLHARDVSPYDGAHAVLLGVPWDGGATVQPGARLAPWHVRRASALVQGYHRVHGVDVFRAMRALDGGNVPVTPFSSAAMREAVEREVRAVLEAGAAPFLVGGDHSITLPALRAVAAKHGPLAVVHVDAHLDTSGPEIWGDAYHHGTPLRHALRENLVARGQLHQIGLRASWGHAEEAELARAHDARLHFIEEVSQGGIEAVMAEVGRVIGDRPTYLTFDVDGVDPAFAPGTGTPVPGGLTAREAVELVHGLAGVRLVGMDLVEVCPALDHAEITSHLAAQLLFEGLALHALSR